MKFNFLSKKSDFLSRDTNLLTVIATENTYMKTDLIEKMIPSQIHELFSANLDLLKSGETGTAVKTLTSHKKVTKAAYLSLPDTVSRGNSLTRKPLLGALLSSSQVLNGGKNAVLIVLDDVAHLDAYVAVLARFDRRVSYKSKISQASLKQPKKSELDILFLDTTGRVVKVEEKSSALAESVAWSISLVDRAPSELNPGAFSKEVKSRFSKRPTIKITEISGAALLKNSLGGIWSVGKSAVSAPRLLALHYKPKKPVKKIAIVGKGVTYDTGGLNIKVAGSMSGMKTDMGGAAAVVAAFDHIVSVGHCKNEVIAVLGLVENAIGPEAYKPDDIVTMHSGKTVEVNNTDAEGRIVLGDCVSWVARKFKADVVIDAATLTGAQLISTGLVHAAVVCNDDELEARAVDLGKQTGDLVCPLVFAPELLRGEFDSKIADMKNSVKNRGNAQSSCAGIFIYSHIEDIKDLKWLHIDMAGPVTGLDGLGTGYGVSLISSLCH